MVIAAVPLFRAGDLIIPSWCSQGTLRDYMRIQENGADDEAVLTET
jgi:hypothetical protein